MNYDQEQRLLQRAQGVAERRLKDRTVFSNPNKTRLYLLAAYRNQEHESFGMVLLDSQHYLLHREDLFRGTIDGASVYPREVVKLALAHNAAAVIFYHNHPSGSAEPSTQDRQITQRLVDALALVDVRVLDHFVVGKTETISFAERGLL